MPKCECGKSAYFGHRGEKAKFCVSHKEDSMINVVDILCKDCDKRGIFNEPGKTGGLYCIEHKRVGMVNVTNKRCAFVNENKIPCYTAPIYNVDGELKGKFCIEHKTDEMVNVIGKRCETEGCKCIAQYNIDGENQGRFCSSHKNPDMIDIKHRRCEFEGCTNVPSYKLEIDTGCRFCALHKLDGMTNGKHPKCKFDGCEKLAGYNVIDNKTPEYCTLHKTKEMIDLKHPLCMEIDCDKRPIFNIKGSKNGLYCVSHKEDHMVDVISPRCKSPFCDNFSMKKYDFYCIPCIIHLFPDKPVTRNHKTKEKAVADFVLSEFENVSWICDKTINEGCSRRRPDLFLDLGSHVLIVEIDENQHASYECSCDNKRLMEISQDIGHRPLIFVRFNPDGYIDNKNNKIKSCWEANKQSSILYVTKTNIKEWNNRLQLLKSQIQYWIKTPPNKTIEIVQLFYDGM